MHKDYRINLIRYSIWNEPIFCPKCLFTFFFIFQVSVTCLSNTVPEATEKASNNLKSISSSRNVWHLPARCTHWSPHSLYIRFLCSIFIEWLSAFSIPTSRVSSAACYPTETTVAWCFFPPLPTVQKHTLEAHSWLYQDGCRKYTVISLWAKVFHMERRCAA